MFPDQSDPNNSSLSHYNYRIIMYISSTRHRFYKSITFITQFTIIHQCDYFSVQRNDEGPDSNYLGGHTIIRLWNGDAHYWYIEPRNILHQQVFSC